MKRALLLLLILLSLPALKAQEYFPKNDGVKERNNNYTAFINATIQLSPDKVIKKGTLIIQNGMIVEVGRSVSIPENSVTIDLEGKSIYPSFIDPYTDFGIAKPKRAEGRGRSPQYEPTRSGFYWNDHIMPENRAIEKFKYDSKKADAFRKAGFGVVNAHIMDGIARGNGVLVALNDTGNDALRILEDDSGQFFSFNKSVTSRQSYPTSLMGAIALLRQFYHDAQWYTKGLSETKDRSIEAWLANKDKPLFFEAGSKSNDIRVDKIGDKFGLNYIIVGGGDEYETIQEISNTEARYILPLDFPDPFDVSNPYATKYLSLADMREWNQAPMNPKVMAENDITFALTTHKLKSPDLLGKNLQKAFRYGFERKDALAALTTIPARLLGKEAELGTLEKGKLANFIITSGDVFDKGTTLYENWVQGQKYVINVMDLRDIRGSYTLSTPEGNFQLDVGGSAAKPKAKVKQGETEYPAVLSYQDDWVELSFTDKDKKNRYRATGRIPEKGNSFKGRLVTPNGNESSFTATMTAPFSDAEKKEDTQETAPEIVPVTYPNVGYGFKTRPKAENVLYRNATVWTGEDAGILQNTDVLVKNGKIAAVGKDLSPGGARVIDATGKHLTAGVIDEHSHIAALSINEAGHNSSAEVSIEDVVDPEDISIYRNLAGGVTSIQVLHGSANPIGGRSAILKLKWGESADEMIYDNSPKFIKFALGENVKQSNWQSYSRFPQTRMGVEQVFVNYFNRAVEYEKKKNSGQPYRYDEEMEVILEIVNGERFISCHSYVQSEINMLMKVAERFGFRVNTFTHILEGYKVADKMAEHGVGGSTFSDWWAYKYEVNDAIPYNAAIMASQGVTVAINSDDPEMSRRLNQEAAKGVKYGGMSEEEAWKMVTINPAKLLHLDDRTGSIREGKDADLVLWSDNPLSVFARAEKTMIDGTIYFDMEKDKTMRRAIDNERNKLVNMMLEAKNGGSKTRTPKGRDKMYLQCETIN